jgi:DNA-binding GntR family transcriptional regulator
LKKLRRSSLSEDAYTFIRKLFLSGTRYNPGDKISVEELSRELGVSRTPLWGAINRLEAEGVVEVVPRLGVYLIDYDPQRMLDMYLVREALEGVAARALASKITNAQIEILESQVEAQRKYLKAGQTERYYSAVVQFHETIVEFVGNPTLQKILASIYAQVRAMRVQRNYQPTNPPDSCEDHEKLLEAFRKRDGNLAEREARTHLRALTDDIRKRMQSDKPMTRQASAQRIAS